MTAKERKEALATRKLDGRPWHRPPHISVGPGVFHLSAACYEHRPHIGMSSDRMARFEEKLLNLLGKLHGSTSFAWNREEECRGRKMWHGCADREVRSERHFWATMNYIHNNPVRHGYSRNWQEWPYSSARAYLAGVGKEEAARIWREYPVLDYGKGWDEPDM